MKVDFGEFTETYNELVLDVNTAMSLDTKYFKKSFIKRTYIRSHFAMIEGVAHQLKRLALEADKNANRLNLAEKEFLAERSADVLENGKVKIKSAKIRTLPNLLFAINSVIKTLDLNFELNKGVGWEALLKAIKIRDRITHPKDIDSLEIEDEEFKIMGTANKWLVDEMTKLIELIKAEHEVYWSK